MNQNDKINYLEIAASNLDASKRFFTQVFDWQFVDYGDSYSAFSNAGIEGGFYQSEHANAGNVLVVLYAKNLEKTLEKVSAAQGVTISKDIFAFPGGRRFHFLDPSNNEFAVWSE